MADVVVIGAGAGGLAAGVALASRGLSVEVLEAGEHPGGKMGIRVLDGVEVDTGPSVLTMPDALDRVLRLAGTSLEAEVTLREPSPAFRYRYPDGATVDVFPRPEETLASVEASLGPAARDELAGFLRYAARIWETAAPHFVYGTAPGLGTMLRGGLSTLGLVARIDPLRTMGGAIRARVKDERLRWLLLRYATYNGSDPRRAPATLNCIAHVELALGGFGVEGGMHSLPRALVRAGERVGMRLRLGTPVRRILAGGGRATGVETADGRVVPAGQVVANADVAHVLRDLLPAPRRPALEPSTSGWVGILRARRRTGAAARVAHEVLFPSAYPREFEDLFDADRPPAEPTVYLCAQEACHGRTGWAEEEPVFVMANAPAEPASGPRPAGVWDRLRETVTDRLRAAGLSEPGDALVYERTPAELAAAFPGSRGAIYGAASNSPLAAFRRPPNRAPWLRGLYLASGSAHPGGGVPLCLLSGLSAARAALADRRMDAGF